MAAGRVSVVAGRPAGYSQADAFFPPNAFKTLGAVLGEDAPRNPSSFHPGGVHVALCDGSARFLRESIDSWRNDPTTGDPPGIAPCPPSKATTSSTRSPP